MMKHFLLLAGALAVFGLSIVSAKSNAKSYDIVFSDAIKVGTVQLAPGEYSLKVQGAEAVFTNLDSGQSFATSAKIESSDKKFEQTSVHSVKDGNADRIETIELRGSTTKLHFN